MPDNKEVLYPPVTDQTMNKLIKEISKVSLRSDVVDNLTTESSTKALSAGMGKKLNDEKYEKPAGGIPKTDLSSDVQASLTAFGASGTEHKSGLVPDPGVIASTTKYLREDGSWNVPPAGDANIIEEIKVNGTALTPDVDKAVDITVPVAAQSISPNDNGYATGAMVYTFVPKSMAVNIAVSDWSNGTCTKSVSGISADSDLVITPDASSAETVVDYGVICTSQGEGTLTFTCESVPDSSIIFKILCFNSISASKTVIGLSVGGTWSPHQFTNAMVNTSGLTFTATYSDGSVASVTPTSMSPSVWGSTPGTQSVTFTYTESGTTVSAISSTTVIEVSSTLENNTWSVIKGVASLGLASQYWNVGDTKLVTIASGTVDGVTISGPLTLQAAIIGINHNAQWENNNSIDFCIGNISDGTVRITFGSYEGSSNPVPGVRMNTSDVTTGGWSGTKMYTEYLPAFYNLLSGNTGLQDAMIAPKKWTHNYTSGSGNEQEAYVTMTEDPNYKMFLMSEYEILGTTDRANVYEQNKQAQYAYYSSRSKARFKFDSPSTSARWWTRSPHCKTTYQTRFANINRSGAIEDQKAATPVGMTPCFRIG